ncbi:MAG TPA: FAD-dependent oxidoreductase [Jatrophihabitantaceae bacterium]|jgi:sarcosine oxidase
MGVIEADVVVVGGGVMGSAAAWELAKRGAATVLLERFEPGHVRGASHGASRMFRYAYPESFYVELVVRSLPLWREIESASGTSLLAITGGVDHGDLPTLRLIAAALESQGVVGEWLEPDEAARRWPGLRFAERVLLHPQSGRLDADAAVSALQQLAAGHGAEVRHRAPVTRIEPDAVTVGDDTYRAQRVVVTAGAWTQRLLGEHVSLPPLRVTQEQPLHFEARVDGEWPGFIHRRDAGTEPFRFVYGMRTPGEGIKVGFHHAGPECDPDRRDFTPEATRLKTLLDYVAEWVPGVDVENWTPISCTYTSTDDEDFVVDAVGNLVLAAGFSGHGFKFAPVIGRLLADLALDGTRPPERFALPG